MNLQVVRILSAILLGLGVGGCVSKTRLTTGDAFPGNRVESGPLSATVSIASYQSETAGESEGDDGEVPGSLSVGGQVQVALSPRFRVDRFDREWDESNRYEFAFAYHGQRDTQVESVTGVYVYYDQKRWDFDTARVSSESVGGGLEFGALLYPLTREASSFDLAFYPYIRGGIGSSAGSYKRVPTETETGPGTSSGDLGDIRLEGGAGMDVRLSFGEDFLLGAGAGVNFWTTAEGAESREVNGAAIDHVDVDFEGHDIYLRFNA